MTWKQGAEASIKILNAENQGQGFKQKVLSAQEKLAFEQAELQPHQSCAGAPRHPCAPTTDSLLKRPPDWLQQGLPANGAPLEQQPGGSAWRLDFPQTLGPPPPRKNEDPWDLEEKRHQRS